MHTTEPCKRIQGLPLRLKAVLISLCLLFLGACGPGTADNRPADDAWSNDASTQRSAPSLSASIQSFLEEPMGDAQRTALERALDHGGKVSRTDICHPPFSGRAPCTGAPAHRSAPAAGRLPSPVKKRASTCLSAPFSYLSSCRVCL